MLLSFPPFPSPRQYFLPKHHKGYDGNQFAIALFYIWMQRRLAHAASGTRHLLWTTKYSLLTRHKKARRPPGGFCLEATPRVELGNRGFADLGLTTWLCRRTKRKALPYSRKIFARLFDWRRHPESNWGIEVLQTSALPLGYVAKEKPAPLRSDENGDPDGT